MPMLLEKPLSDQIALITGGATGIGLAMADRLLAMGIGRVVIASRQAAGANQTNESLNDRYLGQRATFRSLDLRDRRSTEQLVAAVYDEFGSIDVLIHNAGLAIPEPIESISAAGWDHVFETNVRGAMWLTQLVLPRMLQANFGDIIHVSSQAGKHGYADVPSYCASKFALLGLAESVRDEVRRRAANVRVFNFCPGLVDVKSDPRGDAKPGFLHVRNMAALLQFALSLDRQVDLHDIGLTARTL